MPLSSEDLQQVAARTLAHYEQNAQSYWEGTRDHDVSQNIAALLAGKDNYQITAPNGIRWQMAAICTEYAPEAPLDDKMTASLTFKVSGKPTLAAAA